MTHKISYLNKDFFFFDLIVYIQARTNELSCFKVVMRVLKGHESCVAIGGQSNLFLVAATRATDFKTDKMRMLPRDLQNSATVHMASLTSYFLTPISASPSLTSRSPSSAEASGSTYMRLVPSRWIDAI